MVIGEVVLLENATGEELPNLRRAAG